jgi:multidrug efflux pump subunit AcrA (membrane-fusion protein)
MATSRFISFLTRAFLTVVCLVIAFGIFVLLLQSKPKLDVVSGNRSLPAVVVMEAIQIPIARRTVGYGTADALQHADVPAQVASTVVMVPPTTRVGHVLKKGDLLVDLDDVDFQQQVIRAELSLKTAKSEQSILEVEREAAEERALLALKDKKLSEAELERVTEAFNRGAAKQREVDLALQKSIATSSIAVNATESSSRFPSLEEQASSIISTRIAELTLAQENLRRCKVVSPIDGVIQDIDVRVGEHVSNGKRIARIVNSESMEIPLRLPSYARSHVKVMDPVNLRSAGFGKRYWDAHVTRIAPEDDSNSRTMIVYIDVEQDPKSANRIPPGLFLRGEVVNTNSEMPRWVVPRRALRDDLILVVRDSILRSVPIVIDYSMTGTIDEFRLPDIDWAVLETPLSVGDLVVVDPGGSLRDGMSVRTILASEVALE